MPCKHNFRDKNQLKKEQSLNTVVLGAGCSTEKNTTNVAFGVGTREPGCTAFNLQISAKVTCKETSPWEAKCPSVTENTPN